MALYKAAHQLLNLDHGGTVGPVPLSIVGVFKGLDKQASIAPPPLQSSSSAAVLSPVSLCCLWSWTTNLVVAFRPSPEKHRKGKMWENRL